MLKGSSVLSHVMFAVLFAIGALYALPAFPGAEGWGANSLGGRGGVVVHVTNLNDAGPGSLREACNSETPKIIVFDTCGVIYPTQPITFHQYTTFAGQTSPGGGITLVDAGLLIHYGGADHDITMRFMRVRGVGMRDSDGDAIRMAQGRDVIVDHCSGNWACDETFDFYGVQNATCQWSSLSEMYSQCVPGSNIGRYGLLAGDCPEGKVTIHHNLFTHFYGRVPLMSTYGVMPANPAQKAFDCRNNVFYDCQAGGGYFHNDNKVPVNLVGNYYRSGLDGNYPTTNPAPNDGTLGTPVYVKWNYMHHIGVMERDTMQKKFWTNVNLWAKDSFPVPPVTTTTGRQAYVDVLAAAGCFPRDSADRRHIMETQTGTGRWANVGDPKDPFDMPKAAHLPDTDNDGMPDAWETAHGLNPNDAADHLTSMNGGYNAIEVYINELADLLAPCTTGWNTSSQPGIWPILPSGSDMMTVAPNPFNRSATICLNDIRDAQRNGAYSLRVYDAQGKLVQDLAAGVSHPPIHGRPAFLFNTRGLPSGLYVVQLKTGNTILSKRITLTR